MWRLNSKYLKFKKYATYAREPFFEIAKKYSEGKKRIMDMGPGDGKFADYLGREDIYLIEGNPRSCDRLKLIYPNVINARLPEQLSFEDGTFDFIHCSHIIEHLSNSEAHTLFKEINRLLSVGGVLVISAPTLYDGFYNDLSHVKPYNPAVFLKYFVRGNECSATRSIISCNYEKVELVWRFTFTQMKVPIWANGETKTFFNKVLYALHLLIKKIGFGQYQRSGFTLVLRKRERSNVE